MAKEAEEAKKKAEEEKKQKEFEQLMLKRKPTIKKSSTKFG